MKTTTLKTARAQIKDDRKDILQRMGKGIILDRIKYNKAKDKGSFADGFASGCNETMRMLKKIMKSK